MPNKTVSVYQIEYEMKESVWKAYIAGFTQDEALRKLSNMIGGPIRKLLGVQCECRLDAISDQLAREINKPLIKKLKNYESTGTKNVASANSTSSGETKNSTTDNKITSRIKA